MALLQRFSLILLFATLVGCGGSSGGFTESTDGSGDGSSSDAITVSLEISDKNLTQATPQTLTVTVMQGSTPLSDKLVTFTVSNIDLVSFSTDINTSSTDADGKAEIGLLVGVSSGDGSITATVDGVDSNSITFKSAGDGGAAGVPVANDISLFASSQQIASSGNEDVQLTTIAKDINNNLVAGVTITFSSTSGQLEIINSVTGADGQANAILKTNNEPTNRVITITSKSGQVTDTLNVQVTGTSINLTGSSSLAINDNNSFFIQVLNSEGVGIPNAKVDLSLMPPTTGDVAAITIVDSVTTDITGQANFVVTGTTGGKNSIVANAVGVTTNHDVTVQADSFLFSSFNNGQGTVTPGTNALPDVLLSNNATIELTWMQSNTAIADGTIVNFTSTRGTLSSNSASTVDGKVEAIISSTNAGKALVTVTGTQDGITLSNQLEFEFVAESVNSLSTQASPSSIAPNGDTSTISVVAKDLNGNLVKGKTIEFTLTDTSGGNILPATAVTDSNGSASTVYTSNSVSAQDGVSIIATVQDTPSQTDSVTLTVADRNLFITLGTGNELIEVDSATFNKQYVVFVTDVDSASPAKNTVLTVSAVPKSYRKGRWIKLLDEQDEFDQWGAEVSTTCDNEDLNIDGVLDVGEDINGDGRLTPGNVAAVLGEVTTDDQGSALIDIKYPQNFGAWVNINLIVSAKVGGTESSQQVVFVLPAFLVDVLNEDAPPPSGTSPFGNSNNCSDSN
ncbi:Ig-like domain-containing protein [Colwellia sp. PAMC 21821]|uniref:beta strand repeat-containing protein n=1 Tax=Colwellia sp. PAMC 21821 TaxID=1816219 RepID=UPI0009C11582|nr:Ig-like domain-containing protein [Colwellia sp. PAMC 21821]ARD43274.1 hypothetical protein A3Q33_02440 [Colwellia sp. PAMC 21821]